jgi:hypothetical protein
MPLWTPDRYLELARLCRDSASITRTPQDDFLRSMAAEYEAKARSGGLHC